MKSILKKILTYVITLEAKYILRKWRPYIIAVTGNLGKTGTKDAIYAALKNNLVAADGETLVHATKKSMNSEIGIPLTILNLENPYTNIYQWIKIIFMGVNKIFTEKYFKYLILEIGADAPNDIKDICKYIHPDMVVLTAFAEVPVHVENFDNDREKLIREKKYLVEALKQNGILIYNLDDQDSARIAEEMRQAYTSKNLCFKTYATKDISADCFASEIDFLFEDGKLSGMGAKIQTPQSNLDLKIRGAIGESLILSYLPAIIIAETLKLNLEKVLADCKNAKRSNGRMKILDGIYNSIIIDDTYNASPKAVEHGIETVKKLAPLSRNTDSSPKIGEQIQLPKTIFVLGDMLELGEYTREEHLRIGRLAGESCDILLTSGIRARDFAEGALDAGMKDENIFQCDNSILAGKQLLQILEELHEERFKMGLTEEQIKKENLRDIIYIKGSQGSRMERTVKMILAENHDSNLDLVRQDDFWKGV